MQTIYNAQGETKECESVDAREHIASGRWFNEAPQVEFAQTITVDSSADVASVQEVVKRAYNKRSQ
jgi:hypothetical protein